MKLPGDLREFIESLNAANVKYLIVGGYAVAFHGRPRWTGDIDIFVERSEENARRMEQAIARFGFQSLGLSARDFLLPDAVIQLGRPPNRIDVLTAIEGVTFGEAWSTRVPTTLDGLPVCFISRELLVRNKSATGRPQDRADAQDLAATDPAPPAPPIT